MVETKNQAKTYINVSMCHLDDFGGGECGYCHGKKGGDGGFTWGITSNKMTTDEYQKLMDRGWRRCGTYFYKQDFEKSCCQPYTIRLTADDFVISKSQKKVAKTFHKFLNGQLDMNGKSI